MIITTPGYTLTSDGRFLGGGPSCVILAPGQQMDSAGRVYDTHPRYETPLPIQSGTMPLGVNKTPNR